MPSFNQVAKAARAALLGCAASATALSGAAFAQVAPTIDGVARQAAENARDLRELSRTIKFAKVGGLPEADIAQALCLARARTPNSAPISVVYKRFAARALTDISVLDREYSDCDPGAAVATAATQAAPAADLGQWKRNSAADRADIAEARGLGATVAAAPVARPSGMDVSTAAVQIAANARRAPQVRQVVARAQDGGLSDTDVAEAFCLASDIAEDRLAVDVAFNEFSEGSRLPSKDLERAYVGCESFATAAIGDAARAATRPAALNRVGAPSPQVQAAALQLSQAAPDQAKLDREIDLSLLSGLNEMQVAQSLCLASGLADEGAVGLAYNRFAARAETDAMLLNEAFADCPKDDTAAIFANVDANPQLFRQRRIDGGSLDNPGLAFASGGLVGAPLAGPTGLAAAGSTAAGPAGALAVGGQASAALSGGLGASVQSIALQLSGNTMDTRALSKILTQAGVSGLSELQIAQALCFATAIAPTDSPLTLAFVNFAKVAETDMSLLQSAFTSCTDQPTAQVTQRATSSIFSPVNPAGGGGGAASPN